MTAGALSAAPRSSAGHSSPSPSPAPSPSPSSSSSPYYLLPTPVTPARVAPKLLPAQAPSCVVLTGANAIDRLHPPHRHVAPVYRRSRGTLLLLVPAQVCTGTGTGVGIPTRRGAAGCERGAFSTSKIPRGIWHWAVLGEYRPVHSFFRVAEKQFGTGSLRRFDFRHTYRVLKPQ